MNLRFWQQPAKSSSSFRGDRAISISAADEEKRATGEWGSSAIPPPWMDTAGGWAVSNAGQLVNIGRAVGLPAIMDAIRLVSETIAMLDLQAWRDVGNPPLPVRADDSWQFGLLENPALDWSGFDWMQVAAGDIEGYGNFFARKFKAGAGKRTVVTELLPLNPDAVRIRRKDGAKLFDVTEEGKTTTFTPVDIFHIPGFRMAGKLSGYSPVMVHAHKIGAIIALDEFQGRYFANDTTVGLALKTKANLTPKNAARMLRIFELGRRGGVNSHRPMLLYNGAEMERLGLGLRESQFIEASNFGVAEVERMFRLPPGELTGHAELRNVTPEQRAMRMLQFHIGPRMKRILSAFRADPDLFKGYAEYPRFDVEELLRVDAKTAAEVEHLRIQDGSLLVDEARASHGLGALPPIPADPSQEPGKIPQIVPVGGGANPSPPDAAGSTDEPGGP